MSLPRVIPTLARTALAALAVLAVAACGSGDAGDERAPGADPTVAESSADATTQLRERCLSAMPADAELDAFTLEVEGSSLGMARVGAETSDVVAILLPQTSGLCGWGRWAHAAAGQGISSVLVDPCGYGDSECSTAGDADPLHDVSPAIDHAREEMGATRVVLVGTSMGGSLTVQAMGAGADADAWSDVSGPSGWDGVRLLSLAGDLPKEGLVIQARSDGEEEYAAAQRLARRSGARFLDGGHGHGWELLTDLDGSMTRVGEALLAHVEGDAARP